MPDGQTSQVYPELAYRKETVLVDDVNKRIGIKESAATVASLLTRMCLKSVVADNNQSIVVEVTQYNKTFFSLTHSEESLAMSNINTTSFFSALHLQGQFSLPSRVFYLHIFL